MVNTFQIPNIAEAITRPDGVEQGKKIDGRIERSWYTFLSNMFNRLGQIDGGTP